MAATLESTSSCSTVPSLPLVREIVQHHWGFNSFLPLQQEAMQSILDDRDSVVVLPTGGGKSLCFQAPACCLDGLAVVVSPLISLMKDQVDALRANGVTAAMYNSSLLPDERDAVVEAIRSDSLKLLYLAPESLLNENMLALLASVPISLFAIDEAHCISSWGHDFRPEYRGLRILKERFSKVAVHAYTATATERVRHDIAVQLGLDDPVLLVGSFDRPNLTYRIQRRKRGLGQIVEVVDRHPNESGIVYCITRKEVEQISAALNALGYKTAAYHAGLSDKDRHRHQEAFLQERIDIIVATVAFGMGIDKSNVRFVVHAGMPKSLEAYQQESGRAGRDGLEAECGLLYSGGDFGKWKRLIDSSGEMNAGALETLRAIDRFCKSTQCRHQALVEYFGQTLDQEDCQACDVCLGQLELVDEPLIIAQKILSCVIRLEQKFGALYTAQVLAGSEDQRLLARRHDKLSTHGILHEHSVPVIRDWIEQLVAQGCASKETEYNLLQVTDLGWQVLRNEHTPKLLKPTKQEVKASRRTTDTGSWEGVDHELFESLRELRRQLAAEQNVPAYIVFGDASLRDMARRRPTTPEDFLEVDGVGRKKLEDYGEQFLTYIAKYEPSQKAPPRQRTESTASAIAVFPHFEAGKSIAVVAQELGRAESTVVGYLSQYLRHKQVIDPLPWVDEITATRVRAAIEKVGGERLKPIYEHLEGQVTYDQIRIVATCLANTATD
ncbi:MAG: DNA helicase RecQ [Pirellulales bacterium]|nr:DNA helicase RecQ [Pirellulales bacterium]